MRVLFYSLYLSGFFLLASLWTFTANSGFAWFAALFAAIAWIDYALCVRRPLRLGRPHYLLFGIVVWVSLVSVFSDADYLPWRVALQYGALASLVVLFAQSGAPLRLREARTSLATAVLLIPVLILIDRVFGFRTMESGYWQGGRLEFTFGNPNYLAAFLACTFGFLGNSALGSLRSGNDTKRILYVSAALVAAVLIFMTGSRNGLLWLGALTAYFLWTLFRRHQSTAGRCLRRWGWWVGLLTVLALVLWGATNGRPILEKTILLFQGGGASEFGRLTIWQVVAQTLMENPGRLLFGSGWGAVYPLSMDFESKTLWFGLDAVGFRHAHSEGLELWLEGGLVGLALGILLVGILLKAFFRDLLPIRGLRYQIAGGLALGLLVLIGFGMISVATRYVVVLMPAALGLGYFCRWSGCASRIGPKLSWVVIAFVLLLVMGNLYEATRVFRSDLFLAKAVRSDSDATKLRYFECSVDAHPARISSRYEQFSFLASQADPALAPEMERKFETLQRIIPNFKNVHEFYAYYLGNTGDFRGAAEKLRKISVLRTFHLHYLADALFYHWVGQDPQSFAASADLMLYRGFLAETRGGVLLPEQLKPLPAGGFEVRVSEQSVRFEAGALGRRIPESVRTNQPILRYYAMSELLRILRQTIELEDGSARFLTLLAKSDREKVIRLADKLDERDAAWGVKKPK